MDMNKAFFLKKEEEKPNWIVIDATDQVLGRMATKIADILRGKNNPKFTPHGDAGDYVVVINAAKIKLTGDKWEDKEYVTYLGWIGGQKVKTAKELAARRPTEIVSLAVKRMLPKTKLGKQIFKKLKIYMGPEHPHKAQIA